MLRLSALLVLAACSDKTPNPDDTASGASPFVAIASGMVPLDTAPDATGETIYILGSDGEGTPALFSVPVEGGTVTEIHSGAPFVEPYGIAVGDGVVYVADPEAGALFAVSVPDGAVSTVTEELRPMGAEIGTDGSVVVAGTGASGDPGVYSVTPDGVVSTVLEGAPFIEPCSVAVAADGTLYVSDSPDQAARGRILRVTGVTGEVFAEGLWLGSPAGLAVSLDQSTLVASALSMGGTDQVYLFSVADGSYEVLDEGIEENTDAGGVHRAAEAPLLSWADSTAGGSGRVYKVDFY